MDKNDLLPCQKLWLHNKVYGLYGEVSLIAPCWFHTNTSLNIISTWGEPQEDAVIPVMLAECSQHCQFACDREKILLDHKICKHTEASEALWEDRND